LHTDAWSENNLLSFRIGEATVTMACRALVVVGLIEALFPRGVIDLAERIAFQDRGESTLRSWVIPAARLEGLLWILLGRRDSNSALGSFLGIVGFPMLLAPKRTLDTMLALVYKDSKNIELAPWVVPVARAIGILYALIGWKSIRRSKSTSE
jgi:hypothetical protein